MAGAGAPLSIGSLSCCSPSASQATDLCSWGDLDGGASLIAAQRAPLVVNFGGVGFFSYPFIIGILWAQGQ